jgi:Matrixin
MPTQENVRLMTAAILGSALIACALPSTTSAYQLEGGRWRTTTIAYYNEIPTYNWAVDTAAYAWNTSGARIRFVKTSRRNAKVLLGIRWFKVAGEASVQQVDDRFVTAKVGIQSGQDRYTMALVVAHELGHVLGLAHEERFCATMNAVLYELCAVPPPGMWTCRLLHADDVRGAVRLYGGTVRSIRGPEFCNR